MNKNTIAYDQKVICRKYSTEYVSNPPGFMVGVSENVKDGVYPIHGLRHPVTDETTGWYIWAGEYSGAEDFFQPVHFKHLPEWNPEIVKFLGLPPGYRFLIAPNHEDIWFDADLLDVE